LDVAFHNAWSSGLRCSALAPVRPRTVSRAKSFAQPRYCVAVDILPPGLPTSIRINPAGCEIGYLAGPAEWASEDAIKLVQAAIGG